ncbi:hypothetical protein [Leeia sp.]|uniref:hypothetical protein n=1 Tax=Leeia sp. TaxID=2884678 RepID=UPI0035B0F65D
MHADTDWLDYPAEDTLTPPPPSTEQAAHARRLRERRAALEERRLAASLAGLSLTPAQQRHALHTVAEEGRPCQDAPPDRG